MQIEYLNIAATIISALIGAIAGYIIARLQIKFTTKSKKDELAQTLTSMEFDRLNKFGVQNPYSAIAHWVVIRQLVDQYGGKSNITLEKLRDDVNAKYKYMCQSVKNTEFVEPFELIDEIEQKEIKSDKNQTPQKKSKKRK